MAARAEELPAAAVVAAPQAAAFDPASFEGGESSGDLFRKAQQTMRAAQEAAAAGTWTGDEPVSGDPVRPCTEAFERLAPGRLRVTMVFS